MNTEEWFYYWLSELKGRVKPSTYVRYEKNVRLYVLPFVKGVDISALNHDVIYSIVASMRSKRLSSSAINGVIAVINGAMARAQEVNLICQNPCRNIKRAKRIESNSDAFSLTEQRKIEFYLTDCKNVKLTGVKLCLYLGLRIGELLALTWSDVNFEEKTVFVTKTIDEKGNVYTSKTAASMRILPIPDRLISDLKKLKRISTYYVIETDGHYTNPRVYRDAFARMLRRLNIRPLKFHSLRHTFATRAIECGIDAKTLSELMGHSNVFITLNRYTHVQMEQKRKAINCLNKLYKDK